MSNIARHDLQQGQGLELEREVHEKSARNRKGRNSGAHIHDPPAESRYNELLELLSPLTWTDNEGFMAIREKICEIFDRHALVPSTSNAVLIDMLTQALFDMRLYLREHRRHVQSRESNDVQSELDGTEGKDLTVWAREYRLASKEYVSLLAKVRVRPTVENMPKAADPDSDPELIRD